MPNILQHTSTKYPILPTPLTVEQVCVLYSLHPKTVQRLARQGLLPVFKVGKNWRFYDVDLVLHFRAQSTPLVLEGAHAKEIKSCHFTKEKTPRLSGVKFTVKGKLIQQSTGSETRKKAKKFEARLKVELLDKTEQVLTPAYTWNQAVEKYYAEKLKVKISSSDRSALKWLDQYLSGVDISTISRTLLADIGDTKLTEEVEPSTVNRMMRLVRAILNQAVIWEWLHKAPKVRMLPESVAELRFISRADADRLVTALPPYLAVLAEFSFQTGLRMANATQLKWSQLDLSQKLARIPAANTKMRKPIAVPLSDVAIKLILSQMGKHDEYVFVHNGKPTARTSSCAGWYAALKATSIGHFRWHDIRRTWASRHVQNGTTLQELKELGGWADYKSVLIYAQLDTKHLAKLVNLLTGSATLTATQEVQEMAIAA